MSETPRDRIKNLGIIPTRGGSKGLENKNIRPLEGKPLLGYTIEAAKQCAEITQVLVTTDDANIEAVANYIAKTPVVLGGSMFGKDSRGFVMPKERSVNINDEVDFICAAALLQSQSKKQL